MTVFGENSKRYSELSGVTLAEHGAYRVIASKPFSSHPDYWYLRLVLVERAISSRSLGEDISGFQYVTYFENISDSARTREPAYHAGTYFGDNFNAALKSFNKRGHTWDDDSEDK